MLLRNMKIGQKLATLIVISALFIGIVGITGYNYMNQMAQNSDTMYIDRLLPITWLSQIRINNRAIDAYMLELMLTTDSAIQKDLETKTKEKLDENEKLISDYEKTKFDSFEAEKFAQFKENYQVYKKQLQQVVHLTSERKNAEAYEIFSHQVKDLRNGVNGLAEELSDYNEKLSDQLRQSNTDNLQRAVGIMIGVMILAIGLCITLGFFITRIIAKPVKEIQTVMAKAEMGDFTVHGTYKSKDEIGLLTNSFNQMLQGLRGLIHQVTETSEQVAASFEELSASAEQTSRASEQIASTIQEVASGTDKQVQSIEETSQTINEMSRGVQQIAANTQSVSATANQAAEKTLIGNQAIQTVVQQMNSIHQTVTGLAQIIKGLGERSQEIGQIIEVITGISAQTNLLALNAAIEAARAGENGRGFAVVADEVRKLAEQSAESARQISQLIANIQDETVTAVETMQLTTSEVSEGIGMVHSAGDSFEQIHSSIKDVANQIQEVSTAVQQISAGTEQIVQSVDLITEVAETTTTGTQNVAAATEEQLASMEEISSSTSSLSKMAEELQHLISKFKV